MISITRILRKCTIQSSVHPVDPGVCARRSRWEVNSIACTDEKTPARDVVWQRDADKQRADRPHRESQNLVVATNPLLFRRVIIVSSAMRNVTPYLKRISGRLFWRTVSRWIAFVLWEGLLKLAFGALPISTYPILHFCKPPCYQFVTVRKFVFQFRKRKAYNASADFALHSPLCAVCFSSYRAALWQWKLFPPRAVALACLFSVEKKQRSCTTV